MPDHTSEFSSPLQKEANINLSFNAFVLITGYLFFIVYIIISQVFYQERMIPLDGAFYTFKMVETGTFNLELGRIGAITTQILPVLALKYGYSLETILRLYSLNFIVVQLVIFMICVHVFRNYKAGLAILLVMCIGYRHQFYYTVSEIHQTLVPVILLFTVINSGLLSGPLRKQVIYFISYALICFWVANIHILAMISIGFVLAFSVLKNYSLLKNKTFWISAITGFLFFILKITAIEKGGYDDSKMMSSEKIKIALSGFKSIPSYKYFNDNFYQHFMPLLIVGLIVLIFYTLKRKWLRAMLVSGTCIGFLFLIVAYNIISDSPVVYQNYYPVFGIFICLPFCIDVIERFSLKSIIVFSLFILSYSTIKILDCAKLFVQRMEYYDRVKNNISGLSERKFIINEKNINWDIILTDWNVSFESLVKSSIESPDSAFSFATPLNYADYDTVLNNPSAFIGVDFAPYWFTVNNPEHKYWRLKNTTYRILSTEQSKDFSDTAFNSSNFHLNFPDNKLTVKKGIKAVIPITIFSTCKDTLRSIITPDNIIVLSYHLLDWQGKTIQYDGVRTRLETDIYPGRFYNVSLNFNTENLNQGKYFIIADIVTENKRWWNINKRLPIEITK